MQVVIGGSKSPREKAAEEEAIKAKVTKIEGETGDGGQIQRCGR